MTTRTISSQDTIEPFVEGFVTARSGDVANKCRAGGCSRASWYWSLPNSPLPRHPPRPIPRGRPAIASLVARAQVAGPVVRVVEVESLPRVDRLPAAGAPHETSGDKRGKLTPPRLMSRPIATLRRTKPSRTQQKPSELPNQASSGQ